MVQQIELGLICGFPYHNIFNLSNCSPYVPDVPGYCMICLKINSNITVVTYEHINIINSAAVGHYIVLNLMVNGE